MNIKFIIFLLALTSFATAQRVVFLGASIIQWWNLDQFFPGKDYINKGIAGQTSFDLEGRVQQDAIDLQPDVILIQIGSNDLTNNEDVDTIVGNIENLYWTINDAGIRVVLSAVLPSGGEYTSTIPNDKVNSINADLIQFCNDNQVAFADFHSVLVDGNGEFDQALTKDGGHHPNDDGYARMAPVADDAINWAMNN